MGNSKDWNTRCFVLNVMQSNKPKFCRIQMGMILQVCVSHIPVFLESCELISIEALDWADGLVYHL